MGNPQGANWHGDMRRFEEKMNALAVQVEVLAAKVMSRPEIEADLNKRVSIETYQSDARGVSERLARLENGPQKMLGWISLIISGGIGCLASLISIAGLIVTIVFALHK